MESKTFKYKGEEITVNINPTHDMIDMDNGSNPNDTNPQMAAHFARHCEQALELLGHDNMQIVRVSATPMGMGPAMSSGEYIDIYHSPRVFQAIKEEILARKAQWEEIAAGQE